MRISRRSRSSSDSAVSNRLAISCANRASVRMSSSCGVRESGSAAKQVTSVPSIGMRIRGPACHADSRLSTDRPG
jgi:hypothetical protein